MGRRGYPAEFRRKVLDLVQSGRPVADVARALGISDQTIYTWRRQDRIDNGLEPGLTSAEKSELEVAKRRIAALEAELAVHRRASELLGKVVPPKGGSRPSRGWPPKDCRCSWPPASWTCRCRATTSGRPARPRPAASATRCSPTPSARCTPSPAAPTASGGCTPS